MSTPEIQPQSGALLVAPPMMLDPNFHRAVVLLCEHSDEGSFGLILNRPLTLSLGDVLQDLPDAQAPVLSTGGPVQPDTLHFIHRHGDVIPKSIEILDGIFWGGDFDLLKALVADGRTTARDIRFFLGYAGWSPGQLADEVEQGGWILTMADGDALFPEQPDQLWRAVLRRMGGEYALLSNFPADPRMN